MKERSKKKLSDKVPFFFSLQLKYAMSYLAILAVVLMLLWPNARLTTATSTPAASAVVPHE